MTSGSFSSGLLTSCSPVPSPFSLFSAFSLSVASALSLISYNVSRTIISDAAAMNQQTNTKTVIWYE